MEFAKTLGRFAATMRPTLTDWVGVGVCLFGVAIVMFGPRPG